MGKNQTTTGNDGGGVVAYVVLAGTFQDIETPGLKINDWLSDIAPRVGADARKEEFGFNKFGDEWDIRHPAEKPARPLGYMVHVFGASGLAGLATIIHSAISGRFTLTILEYPAGMEIGNA